MKTPILETERLLLRPLTTADAPAVFACAGDERVARYMAFPRHETTADTLEWLQSLDNASDTSYDFGFIEKASGELIGVGGLYWEAEKQQWRLGYYLRHDRWRRGFATEAALKIVQFAKETLHETRIGSCHAVENPRSGQVIRNCGLVFTGYGTYEKLDGSERFRCKEYLWTKTGEELTHHKGTQVLHTDRLVLRRFCETDAADIFAWAGNPEVTRYVSYQTHRSIADSEKILQFWLDGYKREDNYNWAITFDGQKVVGQISVTEHDGVWDAGMGWQLDKPYWNRGYMTEAARAVFEYLFCEVGFHRIYSGHDTRNPASGKVMQKLGMAPEGIARQHYYKSGFGTGDAQKYGILKEEWLDNRR